MSYCASMKGTAFGTAMVIFNIFHKYLFMYLTPLPPQVKLDSDSL